MSYQGWEYMTDLTSLHLAQWAGGGRAPTWSPIYEVWFYYILQSRASAGWLTEAWPNLIEDAAGQIHQNVGSSVSCDRLCEIADLITEQSMDKKV